mmetsp:Transcript_28604/g.77462  ORF Transcript_28604/g.77462 Transcript_28604/m.77462 type:complete len:1097 (+) Transcript_28604:157-3447(+)|eukprot:CAMPEP_0172365162 /NCGR_PEP_ID=MMETSP1060-20121228/8130_1 /TAXON_ID=37318 /ORGANISM="Pseudo-nitzschia pungens, Strain cf. cingulata" /LENGTH=1096 /DNA_ID=CAMNT_0013088371 /DNA_START=73 /DNA_END=3363 /DNA_ORIENTATION=+
MFAYSTYYKFFGSDDDTGSKDFWANLTNVYSVEDDFTSNYEAVTDITVDTVLTSIYLNGILFVVLMLMYEWLRRILPSVYSSEMKRQFKMAGGWKMYEESKSPSQEESLESKLRNDDMENVLDDDSYLEPTSSRRGSSGLSRDSAFDESFMEIPKTGSHSLPEVISLNWVSNVLDVPWDTVRKYAGLDGYFFLRYIRMNLRICSVTCIWAFIVLIPTYATGYNNDQEGWYHMSVANLREKSWRLWIPTIFAYSFSGFVCFVMKQEYRHFLELRMDFLARGTTFINPQHHYSLMVENIPHELRSEKALSDYFESLFPGKVHSTSIVLNLPDLETVAARCMRVCRRLEKSIAYYHATGERATHNVGSPRMTILGIDMAPFDGFCFGSVPNVAYVDNRDMTQKPQKGTHVDSISYYTCDLADMNEEMCSMQRRKSEIAFQGTHHPEANNWFTKLVVSAYEMADEIMLDSAEDNALRTAYTSLDETGVPIPQAELMDEKTIYGTLQGMGASRFSSPYVNQRSLSKSGSDASLIPNVDDATCSSNGSIRSRKQEEALDKARSRRQRKLKTPGEKKGILRRWAGRLGLDFVVSGIKFTNRQIDHAVDGVLIGSSMSSTGFITFLDLTSLTTAVSTPLTSKPEVLDVCVAPEPKDIIWRNAHISLKTQSRRENNTNIFLGIIGLLWIFPLTTIQAFARADYIAKIPGMEWILTAGGGSVSQFVNGYLPVAALLALTMILPIIFEFLARNYERRKRLSDVQNSMLGRYFYFQVLNLYVSVTAGSVWKSLADIIDHPTSILSLLGESMPFMVGYFVSLLVTKVLVGLPTVFLRFGALSKMCLRRMLSRPSKLTQRELDEMYCPENVLYGWEFPAQIFVMMIIFTYVVICPMILPFGALYFGFSLIVYKKQILYVYQPVFESGGAMFPGVLQKTVFSLALGQLTFIGYLFTRKAIIEGLFLLPLPFGTIWIMHYFDRHYGKSSTKLSLERAREYDRVSEWLAANRSPRSRENDVKGFNFDKGQHPKEEHLYGIEGRRLQFQKDSYRQPVLTRRPMIPKNYRRGQPDPEAEICTQRIRDMKKRYSSSSSESHSLNHEFIGLERDSEF